MNYEYYCIVCIEAFVCWWIYSNSNSNIFQSFIKSLAILIKPNVMSRQNIDIKLKNFSLVRAFCSVIDNHYYDFYLMTSASITMVSDFMARCFGVWSIEKLLRGWIQETLTTIVTLTLINYIYTCFATRKTKNKQTNEAKQQQYTHNA